MLQFLSVEPSIDNGNDVQVHIQKGSSLKMKFSKLHFGLDLFDLKGSKVQGQTFFTEFGRRLALFLIITI